MTIPKIKICGITQAEEIQMLNRAEVDYAGFVFYGPSKRNIDIETAKALAKDLDPKIKKTAVTVSPSAEDIKRIEEAGFADIIQIHGEINEEVLGTITKPVWYAVNIADPGELEIYSKKIAGFSEASQTKIKAIVADAAKFGSGQTFNWNKGAEGIRSLDLLRNRQFILAGGLDSKNVAEGIAIFRPDIVDVSSNVEGPSGKDEKLINEFAEAVRNAGRGGAE